MADRDLQIKLSVLDDASSTIKNVGSNLDGISNKLKSYEPQFKAMAVAGTVAFGAVSALAIKSVKDYGEAEKAQKMLEHAVIGVTHATQDQLNATMELADALERKGVLDGDNIKMGLAQLSTFGLSNDAVRALGGSLADLAVNQFGVSASGEDLSSTANMIAKALNGQFGVLEKSGIRFTDLQKKIIETGTEMEKVKAINEGFAQNLKFTNDVALQTSEGGMAKLKVQLGNISENIGRGLQPALNNLMGVLEPIVNKIVEWTEKHPKLTSTIIIITGILGGLTMAIGLLGLALPPVITGLGLLTGVLTATAFSLGAVTIPIWAVILAIAILATGVYLVIKNWETIKDFFINLWESVLQIFEDAWSWIVSSIVSIYTEIDTFIRQTWENIKLFFQMILDSIKSIFTNALNAIKLVWTTVWTAVSGFATSIWETITGTIGAGWDWIKKKFDDMTQPIQDLWSNMWGAIGNTVTGAWEGIKSAIKESINWIIRKINSFIEAVNRIAQKGAGVLGINLPTFPTIPLLAKGGIVTKPTLAMIGEAGPEAVVPLNKMNNMGGGSGVTIIVNGDITGEDLIDRVSQAIMKNLRVDSKLAI